MDIRDFIIDIQKDFIVEHEVVHTVNTHSTHSGNSTDTDNCSFIRTVQKDFPSHCIK